MKANNFVSFRELAHAFRSTRLKSLSDPTRLGFQMIGKNIIGKKMIINAVIKSLKGVKKEKVELVYADQNPNGQSREAKMVKTGIWQQHEAGWLWMNLHGKRIWLAKSTPEGTSEVKSGWSNGNIHVDDAMNKTLIITLGE